MRILLAALLFSSGAVAGILGPRGLQGNHIRNPDNWIAIVGDSGVTGAASSSRIEPTVANLFGMIADFLREDRVESEIPPLSEYRDPARFHIEAIEPLTRVAYAKSEYAAAGGFFERGLMNWTAKLAWKLDVPEHAFGYMVGRARGVLPGDIVLVGQDGVMVKTIGDQFARIFEMKTKTLPPLVLVSFTANDLCDKKVFQFSPGEWSAGFEEALRKAWRDAGPYLKAHAKGTEIAVLAPLDVMRMITDPEILAQTTNVEGQGEISCGTLRHGETRWTPGAWLILRMLNLMCPSVTATHLGDEGRLEHLREVQLGFVAAWKKVLTELNTRYAGQGLRFRFLERVRDVKLAGGDVGKDCFHPSVRGHEKLAEAVLQELAEKP